MNWLKKFSHTRRAASGLEWTLWRRLPLIALVGTALPLLCLGLAHLLTGASSDAAALRRLQLLDYQVWGLLFFHWSLLVSVAIGCVIVMVMKGPGYVADGYRVSHSDEPRSAMETIEEAQAYRLREADAQP